jgi:hypothetical protein
MKMTLFPPERMQTEYPWTLWAVGWLAVFKAFLWLAYEPALPDMLLRFVGVKYLLAAAPLFVCAVGLWNRRRWAVWGLGAIAVLDLLTLLVQPRSLYAYLVDSEVFLFSVVLSAVALVCSGPLGNVLILASTPSLFKHTRR